ncbi:MAG: L-seryl-tRNA(Sec) selenium transferase [Acidimicrobiales bacterium]
MRPPSVDALARSIADVDLPHPLLVDAARRAIADGDPSSARDRAVAVRRALLGPVINASGVLLHTNLGRAPFATAQPAGYTNLELDLATGRRGSRRDHVGALLATACGAEAALVVNNGAAAVLLVLAALARGRAVVVSRGELVEIGGGFRVPEVMAESGARLVEVGTTNRTRRADYETAVGNEVDVGLVLKVHQSNYTITGFTEATSVADVVGLGPPVVVDLGSGLLDAACPWLTDGPPAWLRDEPSVRQTIDAGAALAVFSGDKLLGGPQAGIIAGRAELIDRCARHPLYRAMRPGGLVLRALQDVALTYLGRDGDALPFWRMATTPVGTLWRRAGRLAGNGWELTETQAVTGGGTLPGVEIPSAGLAHPGDLTARLRGYDPPIIARVDEGRTIVDLRTVDPADDPAIEVALAQVG